MVTSNTMLKAKHTQTVSRVAVEMERIGVFLDWFKTLQTILRLE
tara:strand:+ start:706 stop:837 length:132 start_codon:yes stop_codon:yes gene_type:complete